MYAVVIGFCAICGVPLHAQGYVAREVLIPWIEAGKGLDALLVFANVPSNPRPLVVITHGTSRDVTARTEVSPWAMLPQATWFAQRGWVALTVVRRGYGRSGGRPDWTTARRGLPDYEEAGEHSADDLRQAIVFGGKLPEVDPTRVLAVGVSTGGFATVALTANPPKGLVAAISFAGGRGSIADHEVRAPDDLVDAFRRFGRRSKTPMLWIYAENDQSFWPELATKFERAFRDGGGQDEFVLAPPIGRDGHTLFQQVGAWSSTVEEFLKTKNLTVLAEPLPAPIAPDVPPPIGLNDQGQRAFQSYLLRGPHKAFAKSDHGWGVSTAQLTESLARRKALDNCQRTAPRGEKCAVVSIDGSSPEPR